MAIVWARKTHSAGPIRLAAQQARGAWQRLCLQAWAQALADGTLDEPLIALREVHMLLASAMGGWLVARQLSSTQHSRQKSSESRLLLETCAACRHIAGSRALDKHSGQQLVLRCSLGAEGPGFQGPTQRAGTQSSPRTQALGVLAAEGAKQHAAQLSYMTRLRARRLTRPAPHRAARCRVMRAGCWLQHALITPLHANGRLSSCSASKRT